MILQLLQLDGSLQIMADPATIELHDDVVRHILRLAPAASFCNAHAVSRNWRSLAADCWQSQLWKHFQMSSESALEARHKFAVELGWRRGGWGREDGAASSTPSPRHHSTGVGDHGLGWGGSTAPWTCLLPGRRAP